MTVKLRKLKEQPLLSPVGEREWWSISRKDEECMNTKLGDIRSRFGHPVDIYGLAMMDAFMVGAGVIDKVAVEDERRMLETLDYWRKHRCGFRLAEQLPLMKKCGIQFETTEEDRQLIQKEMDDERRKETGWAIIRLHFWAAESGIEIPLHPDTGKVIDADKARQEKRRDETQRIISLMTRLKKKRLIDEAMSSKRFHGGMEMMETVHEMMVAGIIEEVPGEDMKKIGEFMAESRQKGNGMSLAKTHFLLREMGMAEKVTAQDKKIFKQRMDEARRKKDGWDIAEMHYYLRRILTEAGAATQEEPAPPLKRFAQ